MSIVFCRKLSPRSARKTIDCLLNRSNRQSFLGYGRRELLITNIQWDIETRLCRVQIEIFSLSPITVCLPDGDRRLEFRMYREINFKWALQGFKRLIDRTHR